MNSRKEKLCKELERIEEDALYSMKGHYNASARWRFLYLFFGIINVISSVFAGITSFSEVDCLIKVSTIIVAVVTGLSTFLECSKKAENHRMSGNSFLKIKNRARFLKDIRAEVIEVNELETLLAELLDQKDELNSASLPIPKFAYEKAKKEIKDGNATYQVDKKE